MQAIATGDRSALACLFDRHAPLLLAICRRVLRDDKEADDALIDVFHEVWTDRGRSVLPSGSPLNDLILLTRRRSIDRLRRLKARSPQGGGVQTAALTPTATVVGPVEHAEFSNRSSVLREALAALTPDQRAALEHAFFDGLNHEQVASRLGTSLSMVRSAILHGFIRLREALKSTDEDVGAPGRRGG